MKIKEKYEMYILSQYYINIFLAHFFLNIRVRKEICLIEYNNFYLRKRFLRKALEI